MIKQYLGIKERYPDSILFYRMGDFYEMFFEDAQTASRALEITLTSRNKNDEVPVPMCGVPHRAARNYIARLIDQGFKVAICDQVEDPATARGLVKRDVVRVITPGMIIDNELLDAKTNNYLLAVARHGARIGISFLDISTGTFRLAESDDIRTIAEEVRRIDPSEALFPDSVEGDPVLNDLMGALPDKTVTRLAEGVFDFQKGRSRMIAQFNTLNLEGFGCEHLKAGVGAAGALLHYVRETQKQATDHLTHIETYGLDHYLMVDETTCKNLELLVNIQNGSRRGTLLDTLDRTITAMGGRLLKQWIRYPLIEKEEIEARHEAVEEAVSKIHFTREIRDSLKSIHDLERLGSKISMGQSNARDLTALKRSLKQVPVILDTLGGLGSPLFQMQEPMEPLYDLSELIDAAIREDAPPTIHEGGIICDGYSEKLDELIGVSRDGKGWLARLEAAEREETGIQTLKVRFNKVFGYYIEIPKARSSSVPEHYIRKQTLVNAERFITDDLKQFEEKVLNAEEERAKLEHALFEEIRDQAASKNRSIQNVARFMGRLDCLTTFAEIADLNRYHRPRINEEGRLWIREGRHPVIEKMIVGERFVPNTIEMDDKENQVLVITGPNMAGKSTILRQVALMVLMSQMGAFVPALEASLSITDRIFTRIGALDNLSQGQSTFMVEMQETANILNNASRQSLVIMDEIGRGTSTFDGMSIAWAVAEYLHDLRGHGVKTLFATHYHELTELSRTKSRLKNFNIAVKEWNDEIIFLRKLVAGGTNRSYGIQVARLAGVPNEVIQRAKAILLDLETQNRVIEHLTSEQPAGHGPSKGHVQLNLFQDPGKTLIDQLIKLDIAGMTPLEALNRLNELQERAKSG